MMMLRCTHTNIRSHSLTSRALVFAARMTAVAALVVAPGCSGSEQPTPVPEVSLETSERRDAVDLTTADGSPCDPNDHQCDSDFCVDGVCCNADCEGSCVACLKALTGEDDGTCAPELADNSCGEAVCNLADVYGAPKCDGAGSCLSSTLQEACGLYACQDAGGDSPPSCPTSCTGDSECDASANAWCHKVRGECVVGKYDGELCAQDSECGSNQCIDGACCRGDCGAGCYSCNTAYTGVSGSSQGNPCSVNADCGDGYCLDSGTCIDRGLCEPVLATVSWGGDCVPEAFSTCGRNGYCNGSGTCSDHVTGTECSAAYCVNEDVYGPSTCDGGGTCNAGSFVEDCSPYNCSNGACRDSCGAASDCSSGNRCCAGVCTDKKCNGSTCSNGGQCLSGNCVDGYCCESACGGTCEACNRAKTGEADGLCREVTGGTDPDSECDAAACNASSTAAIPRSTCSSGSCSSESASSCAPFTCASAVCHTSCPSNLNGDAHENCAPLTPYCIWGYCYDNRRPVANPASHTVQQTSSTTFYLTGTDPDGDDIDFQIEGSPSTVELLNAENGEVRYTPNQCGGNAYFEFRVYDRDGGAGSLTSEKATITMTIDNIRPTISAMSNANVSWGQSVNKSFTYGDVCTSASSLTVSSRVASGSGSSSVSTNNGSGTATWDPANPNIHYTDVCEGSDKFNAQTATVVVDASDGNMTGSSQFDVHMSAGTQCSDECTVHILWCQKDDILPTNCVHCQDYYVQESYCCSRPWYCPWCCNQTCYYDRRENTCDDVGSTVGLITDAFVFFQDIFCWLTGWFCDGSPRCWWD